jgi:hypothetical protein
LCGRLSIPTKRQKYPTREIKLIVPHKYPFLVGRYEIIQTPQYHTATLKEKGHVQQLIYTKHHSLPMLVWI